MGLPLSRERRLANVLGEQDMDRASSAPVAGDGGSVAVSGDQPLRVFNMGNPQDVEEYHALVRSPEFKAMQERNIAEMEERRRFQAVQDAAARQPMLDVAEQFRPSAERVADLWQRYQGLLGRR